MQKSTAQLRDELTRIEDAAAVAGWTDALKQRAGSLRAGVRDLDTESRIAKLGSRGESGERRSASRHSDVAARLVKSEEFAKWREKVRAGGIKDAGAVEVGMLSTKDTDVTADNADITQHWLPGMLAPVTVPMRVGNLFQQATMDGSSVSYLKAVQEAIGSASEVSGKAGTTSITAEFGDSGSPASFHVDGSQAFARKITAQIVVPTESLEDVPALEGQLRNLLLNGPEGIAYKAEDGYLNGTGDPTSSSGTDLQGVLDLSPDEASLGSGSRLSKRIFGAATEIANAGFEPDAVIISPTDAFNLFSEEDSINRPLWGGWGAPYGGQNGLPSELQFVKSYKLAPGTVVVGAFNTSTLFTRSAVSIRLSAEGLGLADKDLILVVARMRQALVHFRGAAPYRTVTIAS